MIVLLRVDSRKIVYGLFGIEGIIRLLVTLGSLWRLKFRFIWFLCGVGSFHPVGISGEWEVHELLTSGSSWMKQQCSTLWFSLLKFVCFSMYSMNHKAPRRYSQGRNFGVDRQQDFTADIVPRRSSVLYDKRVKKGPYNGSRSLVWTSKEFQASEGNRPRKNDAFGSMNSPVSSTLYRVSNQPRKNEAYRSMNSPVSGTGNRVSNQPWKSDVYGSRNSSISGSRVWRSGDNSNPLGNVYASIGKLETARRVSNASSYTLGAVFLAW